MRYLFGKLALGTAIAALFSVAALSGVAAKAKCEPNYKGVELTYTEFKAQAQRCANALETLGVGKGSHVAVMLPNCCTFPVIWLALARLGAVLVGANWQYTSRELSYLLNDSDAEFLVIDSDYEHVLKAVSDRPARLTDNNMISVGRCIDGIPNLWSDLIANAPTNDAPPAEVGLDDPLNIQYTSGTTGFPKGCILPHRAWVHLAHIQSVVDGFVPHRILLAYQYYSFGMLATQSMATQQRRLANGRRHQLARG